MHYIALTLWVLRHNEARKLAEFFRVEMDLFREFKDGEDTPLYLEKLLKRAIEELEKIAAEESDE